MSSDFSEKIFFSFPPPIYITDSTFTPFPTRMEKAQVEIPRSVDSVKDDAGPLGVWASKWIADQKEGDGDLGKLKLSLIWAKYDTRLGEATFTREMCGNSTPKVRLQ